MLSTPLLIYGADGYTGALIARLAVAHGLRPILAGRSGAALAAVAAPLGLKYRVFALEDAAALDAALAEAQVVLHCAGPFAHTSRWMADACFRTRTHYLDITGEIAVFEALAARDAEAHAAGVMVLPGAGFDVVPSDCQPRISSGACRVPHRSRWRSRRSVAYRAARPLRRSRR